MVCFDHTRVTLQSGDSLEETGDYIHANYLHLDKTKANYIACQAPLPTTICDFWRMIWQENVQAIVMLCDIIECGKKKCEEYFPTASNRMMSFGNFSLTSQKQYEIEKGLRGNEIEIMYKNETKKVMHFHWYSWPDKGVPDNYLMCLRVMNKAMVCKPPIVVHCSAGVGRTGTIVTIDYLMCKLQKESTTPTLKSIVLELRDCRHKFVQVDLQYLYIHRVILSYALQKGIINGESAVLWLEDYNAAVHRLADADTSVKKARKPALKSRIMLNKSIYDTGSVKKK
uniref:Protein-tyrosine phosphatase n=1 Tax=Parastrongyloides trichosuri TaxID=131310 RepID=A0A0N4ZVD5_PARTI